MSGRDSRTAPLRRVVVASPQTGTWRCRATTKASAQRRRSAACGRRSVVGTEACGFVRRRLAVRIPSGCVAPTSTNAARRADTKTEQALRRDTKRFRAFSRSLDSALPQGFAQRRRVRRAFWGSKRTRSHGGTEFLHDVRIGVSTADLHQPFSVAPCLRVRYPVSMETRMSMNGREKSESLFVNRLVSEPFSCRTLGARSWRFVFARSAKPLREKFINTERPAAGRLEATGKFRFAHSCRLRRPFRAFGLTQRARRGSDAKVRKALCLVAVNSLCDLCVKTFAFFALKRSFGCKKRSHRTRSTSLATLFLPRAAALCSFKQQNRKTTEK